MLKIVLIFLLIYYGGRFLLRLLAPFLIKKIASTLKRKASATYQNAKPTVKEGQTVIDKKPNTPKKSNSAVGQYIDFEEIK